MAHRKKIENWLEKDCQYWQSATLTLLKADLYSYIWHLNVNQTQYEINYSDLGYIILSSLPKKGSSTSEVREIYQGDNSVQSYNTMINLLSDNLTDIV